LQNSEKSPTIISIVRTFGRIGLLSFGGPAAQIALIHQEIVINKNWLSERQFLNALSFCMLLPGPEAMQLATYSGWRLHGRIGGLIAGLLFILPGSILVLALSSIYAIYGDVPIVQSVFVGIKATVVIIVLNALIQITKRALQQQIHWYIAGLSFIAFFFFSLPFPLVIFTAALTGFLLTRFQITAYDPITEKSQSKNTIHLNKTVSTILTWLIIWLGPLVLVSFVFGWNSVLTQLGYFFSKLAIVTFGGAYSVLAYMAQEVVQHYQWLDAQEMLDGLGLAETTNGPLILVNQFVGYIAAYRFGHGDHFVLGVAGAFIALWATFAPCFLWIFAGAPYIEKLHDLPDLKGAFDSITAAVVGVILNLTVWFSLHVFFSTVIKNQIGPLVLWLPEINTLEWMSLSIAIIAAFALLYFRLGIFYVLVITGSFSLIWHLLI